MICRVCGHPGDTRPYGERGQNICFSCMKDGREDEAKMQFGAHLNAISETEIVLTEHGPIPASIARKP